MPAAVLAACVATPARAAGETTLVLSPAHAPVGGSVAVDLRSDCKLNYLNLTYARYDGATKTGTTLTDGTFDERLQKYRYLGRLTVPGDAAPGRATAFVQPYCGPPEEYPASEDVAFVVNRSVLTLAASPSVVTAGSGRTVSVTGGDCTGPVTSVPLTVRFPGGSSTTVTGSVRARRVSASFVLPPSVPSGTGTVTLARPDACPGSRPAGPAVFRVRDAAASTASPSGSASAPPSPSASASPSGSPSPSYSEPVAEDPPARPRGRARSVLVVGLAVLAVAAAAGGAVLLRRRAVRRP